MKTPAAINPRCLAAGFIVGAILLQGAVFLRPALAAASYFSRPVLPGGLFSNASRGRVNYARRTVIAVESCSALAGATFADDTIITSATFVPAAGSVPAYCDAFGTVESTIAFEVALPAFWNARLLFIGNGGFAGEPLDSFAAQRDAIVSYGFVYAHSNTGHYGEDASWAVGNPTAVVNWANRSVHVVSAAAKLIIAGYYATAPQYSYYDGCSWGGQQGFTEASKYPGDFDGIVAGDPARAGVNAFLPMVWQAQKYAAAPLSQAQFALMGQSIIARCDRLDGLVDGVIADPRACSFQPATDGKFLPLRQLVAFEQMLQGAKGSSGQSWFGLPLGAEADNLDYSVVGPGGSGDFFATQALQYIAPFPLSGNYYSVPTFDFNTDPAKLSALANVANVDNPDLSAFAARGGRLLSYHGWADPLVTPYETVAYTDNVIQTMGYERARATYRLFMVPGMGHCGGGYGPNQFDPLTPVVDWVEAGVAPDALFAVSTTPPAGYALNSRILCAYPEEARYSGGDPLSASSFVCIPGIRGRPAALRR